VNLRLGRYEAALTSFERAESLGFQMPYNIALVALYRGDKESVASQLKREWGYNSTWLPVYKAWLAKLDGDNRRIQEIVAPYDNEEGLPPGGVKVIIRYCLGILIERWNIIRGHWTTESLRH
jgi:hypothetical protein